MHIYTSVCYENELEISKYKEAKCTTSASQYHIQTELIYSTSLVYRPLYAQLLSISAQLLVRVRRCKGAWE